MADVIRVCFYAAVQLVVGSRHSIRYDPGMTYQRRVGRPLIHIGQFLVALSLLSACTSTADIFPLNASARAIGDPDIKFVREGIDQGPVTATMPDGEVLHGHYRVARDGGMVMAFSGGQTATAIGEGGGGVQFVLRGPRTEMLCRGSVSFGGHGSGECQTEDGALWAVSY
jgi:hypothetical protein